MEKNCCFSFFDSYWLLSLLLFFLFVPPVGSGPKSHTSSQMNLSGSSSSLTSDASTKAISLRSYGIGGLLLHKRILLMTQQCSLEEGREREDQIEEEKEEKRGQDRVKMAEEETEAAQRGLLSSGQRRGRCERQKISQGLQGDSGPMPLRMRSGSPTQKWTGTNGMHPILHSGTLPSQPGLRPMTPSLPSEPRLILSSGREQSTPLRPPESSIRKRLMSPVRALSRRSRSRQKLPVVSRPHPESEEGVGEAMSSSPQGERRGQARQRARRPISPNPFLWLCRDRHTRSKTV